MNGDLHKSGPWSKLREIGSLVLVFALLMNAILPSAAVASQDAPTLHQMASGPMDHAGMDHSAMDHSSMAPAAQSTIPDHSDHENPVHCMSSVCCFQEASLPVASVASDAFLTNGQPCDYHSGLPSFPRETKDRPPQQI